MPSGPNIVNLEAEKPHDRAEMVVAPKAFPEISVGGQVMSISSTLHRPWFLYAL